MKALRFYAPEDVRLEDVPEPECGPDEVKLGSRTAPPAAPTSRSSTTATRTSRPPRTIGHEIAGEVVEVGADVNATYGAAGRSATAPR